MIISGEIKTAALSLCLKDYFPKPIGVRIVKAYTNISSFIMLISFLSPFVVIADRMNDNYWLGSLLSAIFIFFMPPIGREISHESIDAFETALIGSILSVIVLVVAAFSDDITSVAIISSLLVAPGLTLGPKNKRSIQHENNYGDGDSN